VGFYSRETILRDLGRLELTAGFFSRQFSCHHPLGLVNFAVYYSCTHPLLSSFLALGCFSQRIPPMARLSFVLLVVLADCPCCLCARAVPPQPFFFQIDALSNACPPLPPPVPFLIHSLLNRFACFLGRRSHHPLISRRSVFFNDFLRSGLQVPAPSLWAVAC